MLEFIKMFGLGILYTLLLPFIIAIFICYIIYVFFNYLVLEAINLFGFFFGYTFTTETELEKKLESMKVNPEGEKASEVIGDELFDDFFLQEDVVDDLKGSDQHE